MATKLFLRNTTANGIGSTYFDMVATAGAAATDAVVNTAASETEIQWTQTAGGAIAQWVSGRAPVGGFTLTTTDISIWAKESNMLANCGGRYRVFKRAADTTETELGGGPFNDGVEFGTTSAEMLWAGNVTDTAFAENDRILLKVYITNVGTMAGGYTCTLTYNAADAATGDSFFNIAETVTFKADTQTFNQSLTATAAALAVVATAATFLNSMAGTAPALASMTESLTFSQSLASSALAVATLTAAATFVESLSAIATAGATIVKQISTTLTATAAAVATVVKQTGKILSPATALASASISEAVTYVESLSATALATGAMTRTVAYAKTLSASVVALAAVATTFIGGAVTAVLITPLKTFYSKRHSIGKIFY